MKTYGCVKNEFLTEILQELRLDFNQRCIRV